MGHAKLPCQMQGAPRQCSVEHNAALGPLLTRQAVWAMQAHMLGSLLLGSPTGSWCKAFKF